MKQHIIFFGSGIYTIPIIKRLKKHGLVLVVTTEREGEFLHYVKKERLPYLVSDLKSVQDIEKIKNLHPALGILASYGAIIPKKVLNLFPLGILNIHPSLLPKYKGPSPIQSTILAGEQKTGVSIIKLDEEIDHGPIVAQERVMLKGDETTENLKKKLFGLGGSMIEQIIKKLENGEKIFATPQNHSKESFTEKISRENGHIDVNYPPKPDLLKKMIRAYYPWPSVWTKYSLFDNTRRIKLLPNNKIQVEGKRVMSLKEFVNGYQESGKKLLEQLGLSSAF